MPSKSSRYQSPTTPTVTRRLWGTGTWLPARRGSGWPNLEPFCHLICKFHFQMKHQAAQAQPWVTALPAADPVLWVSLLLC